MASPNQCHYLMSCPWSSRNELESNTDTRLFLWYVQAGYVSIFKRSLNEVFFVTVVFLSPELHPVSSLSPFCQRSSRLWQSVNISLSRNLKTSSFSCPLLRLLFHRCLVGKIIWASCSKLTDLFRWEIYSEAGLVWAFTKCYSSLCHVCM